MMMLSSLHGWLGGEIPVDKSVLFQRKLLRATPPRTFRRLRPHSRKLVQSAQTARATVRSLYAPPIFVRFTRFPIARAPLLDLGGVVGVRLNQALG